MIETQAPPVRSAPPDDRTDQYLPALVDRWDDLIDWERRAAGEGRFFVDTLRRAGARRVLDVAAGTGFHALTLADAGFEVTAVDGSAEMLRQAAVNAGRRGHDLPLVHADWTELPPWFEGSFDAVVCLGSSFPHLFDGKRRGQVLRAFRSVLRPGGLLLVDHRNFDAIRAGCYRSSGNYYYCGTGVDVSVNHIDDSLCRFRYDFPDGSAHHLEVYPILAVELADLLTDSGFDDVRTFGDFQPDFHPLAPDFVIHVATRGR